MIYFYTGAIFISQYRWCWWRQGIVQDSTLENVGAVFVQPVVSSGGGGGAGPGLAGTLCTHSSQAVGCKLPSRAVTSHYTSHITPATLCSYTHTSHSTVTGDLQDCALLTSEDITVLNIRLSSGRPSHQARDAS